MRLGIDFGGTNIKFGLFAEDGRVQAFSEVKVVDLQNDDPFYIAIGDINSDGRNDLAYCTYYRMVWHYQLSSGSLSTSYSNWYTGYYAQYGIDIGDINNDSRNDIAITAYDYDYILY